ncbi:HIT domain-containing protein [Candidatus Woesearchaeota archaeon]|nr:HIT domain-containing protein [Candidatus Woesearchaeota archaeon]
MPEMTEEQKAMQEKLKNMSPEEIREFQKKQCIFCQIISGKVQSKKIYEDEHCLAVLDINPAAPGHILLMPKEHYPIMPLIPEDVLAHISAVAKELSGAMLNALKVEGINLFIANGASAGQRAQHFMLHIIPRKTDDKIPMDVPQKKISPEELQPIKEKLQSKLLQITSQQKVQPEPAKPAPEKKKTSSKKPKKKAKRKKAGKNKPKKKASSKKPKKTSSKKEGKPARSVNLDDIADMFR